MKLIALLLTISFNAQAAETYVARLVNHAGFSPRPQTITAEIARNGVVTYKVEDLRARTAVTTTVAHIMPDQVKKLLAAASRLDKDMVIDLDAAKPICMDAPSRRLTVLDKTGQPFEIAGWRGCHRFEIPDNADSALIANVLGSLAGLGAAL
ncbi:MAG: hypothetical protein ABL958_18560 [Bdellovibrionia bacterium]